MVFHFLLYIYFLHLRVLHGIHVAGYGAYLCNFGKLPAVKVQLHMVDSSETSAKGPRQAPPPKNFYNCIYILA